MEDLSKKKDLIENQLEKIINTTEFKSKPLLQKFLAHVVTEYIEGREKQLKGYSIGIDVFNQNDNFDPDQNALVRIHAGRLRRLIKEYYLDEGKEDTVIIEIPKGRYIPKITFDNQVKEEKTLLSQKHNMTVTVLPFSILSENKELNYFAQGLAQEISYELTKYDHLDVVGYIPNNISSSFDKLQEIKKQNIRYLIEGDLTSFGKQVQLFIRLKDLTTDINLSNEKIKINLASDNIFQIQENISSFIANKIGAEYGIINQKINEAINLKQNYEVNEYDITLKYYHFVNTLSPNLEKKLEADVASYLQKSPTSATLLSIQSLLFRRKYVRSEKEAEDYFRRSGELAETAYKIDPQNHLAQIALLNKTFYHNERDRFIQLTNKHLEYTPSSPIRLGTYALCLSFYGEWEQGKEMVDEIIKKNINFPLYIYGVTTLYHYRKFDYNLALEEVNKYHVPGLIWESILKSAIFGQLNKVDIAKEHIRLLLELDPDFQKNGRAFMSKLLKENVLVEHIISGLNKAGLSM
ncbi:hypothetical protein EI427_01315 [Flammeovirga pectinis]|uniref:Tetratricopeptide repeat protein n=1 Tax=Flammeovirga pectinis TaxID=2494373 RepID=A0A3Q9FJ75_9BACT|nr:hypothetical protein [Flammeovirga pectinis]AZQ60898.1 hypothetical protein EI427_01315 [Flammeovirga pectinis]